MTGWIDRHRWVVIAVLTIALAATSIVRARAKPFWHDEIYTILMAGAGGPGAIWRASRDGADLAPPLTALLTSAVHASVGPGHVTTRLPATFGFLVASVLLFVMVRRRANAVLAIVAALLPFWTAAYRYSIEARGYGLTLACFALSLYAWGEAASSRGRSRHRWLLALSLASGVWAHYFALLAFLPIVVGESVRQWRMKRVDWPMLGAVAAGGAGALSLAPFAIQSAKYEGVFWTQTGHESVVDIYRFLVEPALDGWVVWALAGAGLAALVQLLAGRAAAIDAGPPRHEVAASLTGLAIPLFGALLGSITGAGLIGRYVLFTTVMICAVVPLLIARITQRPSAIHLLLCAVVLASFAQEVAASFTPGRFVFRDPVARRPVLVHALSTSDRVVFSSGLWYLQFWYYAPPELRGRLTYLTDPIAATRIIGTDTLDSNYVRLRRLADVGAVDYAEFVAAHRAFELYDFGRGWVIQRLEEDHARISERAREEGARLLEVRFDR